MALAAVKHGHHVIVGEAHEKVFKRIKMEFYFIKTMGFGVKPQSKALKNRNDNLYTTWICMRTW